MAFVEDTSVFLADFGVDVQRAAAPSFRAHHFMPGEDAFGMRVKRHTIRYFIADAAGLGEGEPVVIEGVRYLILNTPIPGDDGKDAVVEIAPE